MIVYGACATCGGELEMDWATAITGRSTHDTCRPQPKGEADELFDKFAGMVAKMAAPDYRPASHDDLNLGALQERIDTLDSAPPNLGASAMWYATRWHWPVFPLRPGAKVPATKHGFKDATLDPDRIRAHWTANPRYNIGVPTGIAFDVIDIDLPDGPASLTALLAAGSIPDVHGIAQTSSGGMHLLIAPTGAGNTARINPGIDYRGLGGYVCAAPSWLGPTKRWSWISKPSPHITNRKATAA